MKQSNERNILKPIIERFARIQGCDTETIKQYMMMSLDKEKRNSSELLDELYFYVRGFSKETILNS